jgi:hypothetical protein
MNLPKAPSLIISALALLTFHASAVEYVTLNAYNPNLELNPGDLIESVGKNVHINGRWSRMEEGSSVQIPLGSGDMVSGLVYVFLYRPDQSWFHTLKITRANEVNAVQPTSVLVIPENSTGNYDIVVETSDDTATWVPFHSQTVLATDPKRFFRTRIVKRD